MRRTLLAIGAAVALAAVSLPTSAIAQRHHWGGGFGGPGISFGFGVAPGPYYDYGYSDYGDGGGCYQIRRIRTPFGWQAHRVWVC